MTQATEPFKLRDAASTILLRDSIEGHEVLLLKRSEELSFGPGIWVFPGGKVDAKDGDNPDLRFKNAAVREVVEETDLTLSPEQLTYVMSITTPTGPVRFNTRFFVAKMGENHAVQVDGSEIIDYRWLKPAEALDEFNARRIELMIPTGLILMRLALQASIEQAIESLAKPPHFDLKPVWRVLENGQKASLYPGDHAFPGIPTTSGALHRCIFAPDKNHWEYLHNCEAEIFPPLDGGYNALKAGRAGHDMG